MSTCLTCKFWGDGLGYSGGRGCCEKVDSGDGDYQGLQGAILTDQASMLTLPTFGCTMHEPANAKPTEDAPLAGGK